MHVGGAGLIGTAGYGMYLAALEASEIGEHGKEIIRKIAAKKEAIHAMFPEK